MISSCGATSPLPPPSAGVLFDFVSVETIPASIGTAKLAALLVGDAAHAYAPALVRRPVTYRRRIGALLSEQLELLLSVGCPLGRSTEPYSTEDGVGAVDSAGVKAQEHLSVTLCALLCLPVPSASVTVEWVPVKPLVQHLLAAHRLREVVRASMLEAASAFAGAPSSADSALACSQQPALSQQPPFIETLFGRQRSAKELGCAYALRAALKALAALAGSGLHSAGATDRASAGAAEAVTSGDAPSAKRVKLNPPAPGNFEEEIYGEERQVRVKVRDENAREMRLKARRALPA